MKQTALYCRESPTWVPCFCADLLDRSRPGSDDRDRAARAPVGVAVLQRHGERSRLQLLFQFGGAESLSILAANNLAVNCSLRPPPLYDVKKCVCALHSLKRAALRAFPGPVTRPAPWTSRSRGRSRRSARTSPRSSASCARGDSYEVFDCRSSAFVFDFWRPWCTSLTELADARSNTGLYISAHH